MQIVRSGKTSADSAWAIETFLAVRDAGVPREHCQRNNYDLIVILCNFAKTVDLHDFELVKITSHLTGEEADNPLHLYYIMGNRLADELAMLGVAPERSPLHATAHGPRSRKLVHSSV